MNRGLLLKSLHEVWVISGLFAVALMIVEALLGYVLPTFAEQFSTIWLDLPFVKNMLRALLGVDVGDQIGPEVFASIAWVHPVVLTIIAAHATIFATRLPVGEIDRATIDVLLGLPVSRWGLYRTELVMFLASGVVLDLNALANRAPSRGRSFTLDSQTSRLLSAPSNTVDVLIVRGSKRSAISFPKGP